MEFIRDKDNDINHSINIYDALKTLFDIGDRGDDVVVVPFVAIR